MRRPYRGGDAKVHGKPLKPFWLRIVDAMIRDSLRSCEGICSSLCDSERPSIRIYLKALGRWRETE